VTTSTLAAAWFVVEVGQPLLVVADVRQSLVAQQHA
jgi:hypothetical protein